MLKGPKNTTPTHRGWVNDKGELLKAQKISQAQLDEHFGVSEPVIQTLHEAPVVEKVLSDEVISHHYDDEDEEE